MHRVIGERTLSATDVGPGLARELLADMVLARVFDERAVALQRRGWMSGYPPFEGQEASQVGAAHALADVPYLPQAALSSVWDDLTAAARCVPTPRRRWSPGYGLAVNGTRRPTRVCARSV